jgi:hypothetical protein
LIVLEEFTRHTRPGLEGSQSCLLKRVRFAALVA